MKLAILDRDGTINLPGEDFIGSADEWTPLPGALEAIARLNHAGWHVVVATNQPGLGRGLFDVGVLNAIHTKMHRQLAAVGGRMDAVFYCPHTADEACQCRKPAPGLMEQIVERYGVAPHEVQVVGSCSDHLLAGAALGAVLHWVAPQGAESQALPADLLAPVAERVKVHASLSALVDALVPAGAGPALAPAVNTPEA